MSIAQPAASAPAKKAARIGELCELISGQHILAGDYNTEGKGIGYLTGPADFGSIYPTITRWTEKPKVTARQGDILITVKGSGVGKTNFLDRTEAAISRQLMAIRPRSIINRQFLYLFLETQFAAFQSLKTGAAIPGISREDVLRIEVPTPPLAEQERIVGILDEAFEGIATATAHAERNLHLARELFQSVLQSTFVQKGERWVETTLGESCKMYQPKTIGTKDLVADGPYSVFGANGVIGRYHSYNHEEPQVLVTCRGATCGSVNVSEPFSWVTGNAMVVRPLSENLDLKFLEVALRGGIDLAPAITGAAQPQITRTNLNPIPFCYPASVDQQRAIVAKLDALAAETRRLEAIYERKLAALAELKQSLLYRAFSGKL